MGILYRTTALAFGASLLLSGCSNGGDIAGIDGSGEPVADQATGGPIVGFGSVIVNGVRFDTSAADIVISGDGAVEDELAVGDYVTVIGTVNDDGVTGVAAEVRFQPNVVGPVSAIDVAAETLTALGQTVQITRATLFSGEISPRSIDGIALADRVRVSGGVNAAGDIIATRVDLSAAGDFELSGAIAGLDSANSLFSINGFTIDYGGAADVQPGVDALVVGATAAVRGRTVNGNTLVAEEIEVRASLLGDLEEVDELEIEGYITAVSDDLNIAVNGLPVTLSTATEFDNGSAADLALDALVEVAGALREGTLLAASINFLALPDGRVLGQVEDIEVTDGAIPTGALTVAGQTVTTTIETLYQDNSELALPQFNLSAIGIGDFVVISGVFNDETLVATLITRELADAAEVVELTGRAFEVGELSLQLFAYTVIVNGETEYTIGEEEVTAEMFFANAEGQLVEVEGVLEGQEIVALELKIFPAQD